MTKHVLFDGKLHLYKRKDSPCWQCATYLGGKNWRTSTKEAELPQAKDVAEDWYQTLREKFVAGLLKPGRRFREAAAAFYEEYTVLTYGERNRQYVKSHADKIRLYLNPFFGDMPVASITTSTVIQFRAWRGELAIAKHGKPAARQTLKQDIATLRLILKTAERKGWIDRLPELSEPYRTYQKPSYRAWFSAQEYFRLCKATWAYVQNPPSRVRKVLCQQMHDYVVFMANTGLRPDEAARLEFQDVEIDDEECDEAILVLSVRGKCGTGWCKSMPSAARAYQRLLERHKAENGGEVIKTNRLFPLDHRNLFNRILNELGLKTDSEGRPRSAYSLRHTYVCLRLLNGANIFQLAVNCRTSVGMFEKFYARHISNHIDTAMLNVERSPESRSETGRPSYRTDGYKWMMSHRYK